MFQCSLTNLIHDVFTVWGAAWHTLNGLGMGPRCAVNGLSVKGEFGSGGNHSPREGGGTEAWPRALSSGLAS